jgi:hypothetical protein
MRDGFSEREIVYRAEDLILRLRDVRSCRIITDETGSITEIHVVASSDRPAKMIARDVETALKAELDLEIDYRKIGVVMIDPDAAGAQKKEEQEEPERPFFDFNDTSFGDGGKVEDILEERLSEKRPEEELPDEELPEKAQVASKPASEPSAGPAAPQDPIPIPTTYIGEAEDGSGPGLELLEDSKRIEFVGLSVTMEAGTIRAEVRLSSGGIEVIGSTADSHGGRPVIETVAGAAVSALAELLDEDFHLCLSEIRELEMKGRNAVAAVVDVVRGRDSSSYTGCAFVGRDSGEAAVMAVLDAVNRPFGRWKSIREIHYRIR